MSKVNKQSLVVGLALFSVFFGAGNLIFPPHLGVISGTSFAGFAGFVVGDILLAILSVIASSRRPDAKMSILMRAGKPMYYLLGNPLVGMLLVIPRTCATAYEIGFKPLFPNVPPIVFSVVYFTIVFILMVRPSAVVDYLGKYLTPVLLVGLTIIIGVGIFKPLGEVVAPQADGLFASGLISGYQTFDCIGGAAMCMAIIASLNAAGFTEEKDKQNIFIKASIIAGFFLILVYGGLFFIGRTLSGEFGPEIGQAELLVIIIQRLLGTTGVAIFGVVVILACITTAVGTASSGVQFWLVMFKDKVKYEHLSVSYVVVGIPLSVLGVGAILRIGGMFVSIIYPPFIALILVSLFMNYIKSDNAFIFSSYTALIIAIATSFGVPGMSMLPLAGMGFGFLIPTILAAVIGYFIPSKKHRDPALASNDK